MNDNMDKLSLAYRLQLREAELEPQRCQEARHKQVLSLSEIERRLLDAQIWLEYIEAEVAGRRGVVSRFANAIGRLFGKEAAREVQLTADEVLRFPEVEVARQQYERLVREFAQTAEHAGDAVANAIAGAPDELAAKDSTEPTPPSPSNGSSGRSKWG